MEYSDIIVIVLISIVGLINAIVVRLLRTSNGKAAAELDRVIRLFEERERKRRPEIPSNPDNGLPERLLNPHDTIASADEWIKMNRRRI